MAPAGTDGFIPTRTTKQMDWTPKAANALQQNLLISECPQVPSGDHGHAGLEGNTGVVQNQPHSQVTPRAWKFYSLSWTGTEPKLQRISGTLLQP